MVKASLPWSRCGQPLKDYGDEGSCFWIAVQGFNAFFRQADGRMPRTLLYNYIMDLFHLSDPLFFPGTLEEWTHEGSADQVAAFQRHVLKLAQLGDPVAQSIYDRAAQQLSLLVSALKSRLHFDEDRPVRVSWSGGLFRTGEWILTPFRKYIEALGCEPTSPAYGPLAGAVGYAARSSLSPDRVSAIMAAVDSAPSSEP